MAYYKALMTAFDDEGRHEYWAYGEAYDKKEARLAIRDELLDYEKDDYMEMPTEITEEEFVKGYKEFGNGVRAR